MRIAVLNRGEAATRCLRAIRELRAEDGAPLVGIALYTDPDQFAPFVREADEAISLGPALRRASGGDAMRPAYLDHERVLAALRAMRVDAVWPGWGFLAEDPAFVEKLATAGLIFLGPSADTMRALGDKMTSKRMAEQADVPVSPWSGGPVTAANLHTQAEGIGFPLMVKATAGGGGRGIRLVERADELEKAFDSATTEAANAFGDGTLFLESCIRDARHVEVQMAADQHGRVLALGLRDCSVQRKHQKVVEEGPPPGLSREKMAEMRAASVRLLETVGYTGVATVEFLVNRDESFYFLEVNPRLQVEHGITELLCDVDLVKIQIRVARGDALPESAPDERGHAIEVRLCAEDPASGFAPSPGDIAMLELPSGPGIRVDAGIALGGTVPSEFDSMIAKILARGSTREEARARLVRALADTRVVVVGGSTNKGFLLDVLDSEAFIVGGVDTGWLERAGIAMAPEPSVEALIVAAIQIYQRERTVVRQNFYLEAARGRPRNIPSSTGAEIDCVYAGVAYRLKVFAIGNWSYRVYLDERSVDVQLLEPGEHTRQLVMGGVSRPVVVSGSDVELQIEIDGRLHRVHCDVGGKVRAPSPALLIELSVGLGDEVRAGQRLGLFEAMKTETAFFAPVAGTVRELVVRPGERVSAGDVILVIEPSGDSNGAAIGDAVELEFQPDPLDVFGRSGAVDLGKASGAVPSERVAGVAALRGETRRILMGYDVNPQRAERLTEILEAPATEVSDELQAELAGLAEAIEIFSDIETLFSRSPTRVGNDELGPSNDARLAMYLRRIAAEGAGIAPEFLDLLRRAFSRYGIQSLVPSDGLERAALRLYATQTTRALRSRIIAALLHTLIRLGERGETFVRQPNLSEALDRLGLLRGTVPATVADLAQQARYGLFEREDTADGDGTLAASPPVDLAFTVVEAPTDTPSGTGREALALSAQKARAIELWRFANFDLERVETPGFEKICVLYGRARDGSGDERIFCFAEVDELGPAVPNAPDLTAFEQSFHEAIEAMRVVQAQLDPAHRLQWNRVYLFVRPAIVLSDSLLNEALRRLAPETGHLGLERVVVRLASVDSEDLEAAPNKIEVLAGNPSGGRIEWSFRAPHQRALEPATPYERRVAAARARGRFYPYEILRLFLAPPESESGSLGSPTGPGTFAEYDLENGNAVLVDREPGGSGAGIVFGIITTPTRKHPEGMRRVVILSDPTRGMGALAAPECDRIIAAIDLAERECLPVEWVAVSSGAKIAMDSGTENLDATARVVRRIVTFTDARGEINLLLPEVNVGAQSYFDALAAMGLHTRGILVMFGSASMVLTGRAALEFAGGVAAEDEVGIGGYERIMGPNGEAHYQARDLTDAYAILLEHYTCSYIAPGEDRPRAFTSEDPAGRDITESSYEGEEEFRSVGEIFDDETNPGRKKPFGMRPVMHAVIDRDGGYLERWREWVGAETAIVWDTHLGGIPATLVGIESRSIPRIGHTPNDGPDAWTGATLFPQSSKKVARALNAASGVRPAVILANLSGFDGSPESMRRGILEFGAEIARAVVRFRGPIVFTVVTRYHGGAYVVFSRELNENMTAAALTGSYASVIGGPAAAAVVFARDVRKRAETDPRIREGRGRAESEWHPGRRAALRTRLDTLLDEIMLEKQAELAAEFDAVHSVERAREVGSLEFILAPEELRPRLIEWVQREQKG